MGARTFRILSVGEVLWDLLPTGAVLGGAPANFAVHARSLGANAALVSRVGNDEPGREMLERLAAVGLPKTLIAVDAHAPTGTVSVKLGADGQPHYAIHENVAWDAITADASARVIAAAADAICFGSLAQRAPVSRAAIRELIATLPPNALRVFDINLRQSFYSREIIEESLALANVLKLNDAELPVLAGMFRLTGDALEQMAELARRFELRAIALTRGGAGSLLFHEHHWSQHPGIAADVRDTIGAGDAFTAAFVLGLLHRWPLAEIDLRANEVAAFVCSQRGATPPLPEELRAPFTSVAQPA